MFQVRTLFFVGTVRILDLAITIRIFYGLRPYPGEFRILCSF